MPVGYTAAAIAIIGAGISAYSSVQQGEATAAANKYNAQVAENNAKIAEANAERASAAGTQQAANQSMKNRAAIGALLANQAAAGIDVNTGSGVDVRSSASELGQLDAITIRSNAARTAYGYQTDSQSYRSKSQLDEFEADTAITGSEISAAGSAVKGLGGSLSAYNEFSTPKGGGMTA